MSGFNLPPGVSVNMIPGNRPEDAAEEAFWDQFAERLAGDGWSQEEIDRFCGDDDALRAVEVARDMGYALGVTDGRAEAELAEASSREAGQDAGDG